MAVSQEFLDDVQHGTFAQRSTFVKMLTEALNHHTAYNLVGSHNWEVLVDHPERMATQITAKADWPASEEVAKASKTMPVWFERNAIPEVLNALVANVVNGIVHSDWHALTSDTVKVCVIRIGSLAIVYRQSYNQVQATVIYDVQG